MFELFVVSALSSLLLLAGIGIGIYYAHRVSCREFCSCEKEDHKIPVKIKEKGTVIRPEDTRALADREIKEYRDKLAKNPFAKPPVNMSVDPSLVDWSKFR
jgi:hypothetical protein